MRTLLVTAVVTATAAVAGCSGGTADVAGTVTHKGKPVVYGTVVVVGSDGVPKSGVIQPDGSYRVVGVRTGPAKVAVSSPRPPGGEPAAGKKGKAGGRDEVPDPERVVPAATPADPDVIKNWSPIPDKYADPDKSGLTADVGSGQPVDLDLK